MSILDQIKESQIPVTLNHLRKLKGYSIAEFFSESGCYYLQVLYAEPGKLRVGLEILEGMARALDVDLDDLIRVLGGEGIIARHYDRTWMYDGTTRGRGLSREERQYSKPIAGEAVCNACSCVVLERVIADKDRVVCKDCIESEVDGLLV